MIDDGVRRITDADIDYITDVARHREDDNVARERAGARRTTNDFRHEDRPRAHVEGVRGEFIVARDLHVPLPRKTSGSDGGVDLIAPTGETVQVRSRNRADRDLMCPVNMPLRCDWIVLVVPYLEPYEFRIVGGLTATMFYFLSDPIKLGDHPPSRYVKQSQLRPWSHVRHELGAR